MATQQQRREATRARILKVARRRFAADGYEATTLAVVLRDTGVSKGALYHHFASKHELFAAVFDQVSRETIAAARRTIRRQGSPSTLLVETCLAWLKAVEERVPRTIMLDIAPSALGWREAKAIEEKNAIGLIRANIEAAVAAGEGVCASIDLAAHVINASLGELAMQRQAARTRPTDRQTRETITQLVRGLLTPPGNQTRY